jgi:thiol-disulfide isomerase/thioredoxin
VGSSVGNQAPEFIGITNWINSEPLTLEELRGKVVLLDVWTYTCVNCIRTFPFLKQWHARYADDGLVIVGLHAPEFEFEKETENVVEAAQEYDIVWPIAQDNDFSTWRAYNNQYWPAKYLIDKDGVVRYTHFGEGAYAETEGTIRELLQEAGADLSDDESSLPSDQAQDQTFGEARQDSLGSAEITPELYAGYERNFSAVLYGSDPYVVQTEYYQNRDAVASFQLPEKLKPHKVYFNGDWFVGPENAKHARITEDFEDYIALKYSAKSVNAVITSDSGEPYKVRVIMDGIYLTEENKGQDVMIGEDGESFILVTGPRLYSIVDNPGYEQRRVLELRPNSDDFGLFAFTFGVYQEGP